MILQVSKLLTAVILISAVTVNNSYCMNNNALCVAKADISRNNAEMLRHVCEMEEYLKYIKNYCNEIQNKCNVQNSMTNINDIYNIQSINSKIRFYVDKIIRTKNSPILYCTDNTNYICQSVICNHVMNMNNAFMMQNNNNIMMVNCNNGNNFNNISGNNNSVIIQGNNIGTININCNNNINNKNHGVVHTNRNNNMHNVKFNKKCHNDNKDDILLNQITNYITNNKDKLNSENEEMGKLFNSLFENDFQNFKTLLNNNKNINTMCSVFQTTTIQNYIAKQMITNKLKTLKQILKEKEKCETYIVILASIKETMNKEKDKDKIKVVNMLQDCFFARSKFLLETKDKFEKK